MSLVVMLEAAEGEVEIRLPGRYRCRRARGRAEGDSRGGGGRACLNFRRWDVCLGKDAVPLATIRGQTGDLNKGLI